MISTEKYPENMPWDSESQLESKTNVKWMLTNLENVYIFSRSRFNKEYIYIQKNNERTKAVDEYLAKYTYQRLFDEGYDLATVE